MHPEHAPVEAASIRLGIATDNVQIRTDRYPPCVAHYIFNVVKPDSEDGPSPRKQAAEFMRVRLWGVYADDPHRNALALGDLVLIYLGAPEREFIGRAELASAVHEWTPSEAQANPGGSTSGVLLARVEEWDPPVPMTTVLSQIDPAEKAKADFQTGVVRITAGEYETALVVAAAGAPSTGSPGRHQESVAHGSVERSSKQDG